MVAGILAAHAGAVITNFLDRLELEDKEVAQSGILKFCNEVCGERIHQYLANAVDKHLGECLNFSRACVLFLENDRLFTLKIANEDLNTIETRVVEVPSGVGLTGRCIAEARVLASSYGKSDTSYSVHADNVLKLKDVENIVVVPLVEEAGKKEAKVVGVLQLMNYKGSLSKLRMVIADVKGRVR